jgi:hypothetical protein
MLAISSAQTMIRLTHLVGDGWAIVSATISLGWWRLGGRGADRGQLEPHHLGTRPTAVAVDKIGAPARRKFGEQQ